MEKIRTVTLKDRGKVVMALCHGQITNQEAFDWMVEADNRDWIMKGAKMLTETQSEKLAEWVLKHNPMRYYHPNEAYKTAKQELNFEFTFSDLYIMSLMIYLRKRA